MKDLIKPMLKAPLVLKFMVFLFLIFSLKMRAQKNCDGRTYEIINTIFNTGETEIYDTTLFHKGWASYFESYQEIFSRVGIPTSISNNHLKEILGEDELRKINSAIYSLQPCRLSSKYLNDNIFLSKKFDSKKAISKGVFRISRPIFVGKDIAILKKESLYESPIFILQKRNDVWEIIYTFYDWYVLDE